MFTAFENCKSIEEVANNAARFERMNLKREYTKNSNEIFSIPTTYEFYYENSEMKLLEDVGVAAKHKIEIKKIVSFNTLEQKVILPKFHFCQSKIEERYIGYDFKKHLKFLRSSEGFWLSSGKHMNSYVETLPAANTYKVIEKAVQKYCRVLSTYDIYIGLGYGGVFFSIVAAMLMNKKVVILDMKKEKDKLDINGNILFFDDFMSTGLNIEKACDIVNNNGKKSAILLYAKKNVETCIEYFVCDII